MTTTEARPAGVPSDAILAWHFTHEDHRLGYEDGRLIEPGHTLSVDVTPRLCSAGLHASERVIDALGYAPSAHLCRVYVWGNVQQDDKKLCGTHRHTVWIYDTTMVLYEFACWVAEQALLAERERGREPHPASWAVIEVKRRWLRGEASEQELSAAARSAESAARSAWAAARSAAESAAWAAARSAAARSAAESAAESAVWSAVWSAAWSAAWAAERSAAWSAYNERLTAMAEEMHAQHLAQQ